MAVSGVRQGDLLGMLTNTLPNYPWKGDFFQTFNFSRYPLLAKFASGRNRVDGGKTLNWHVSRSGQGNWQWTRPMQEDTTQATDTTVEFAAKWCFGQTHWMMDSRDTDINGGDGDPVEKLCSTIDDRRGGAFKDAADAIEVAAIGVPENSSDDLRPYGFLSYIVPGPTGTTTDDGFIGQTLRYNSHTSGSSATTTTIAGVDRSSSDNSMLRNWAGKYDKIDASFIKSLRRMHKSVNIRPPVTMVKEGVSITNHNYCTYAPLEQVLLIEELLDSKNSNWGLELDGKSGVPVFQKIPIEYLPSLDLQSSSDTNYYRAYVKPIITIDHDSFQINVLRGRWKMESPPIRPDKNHNAVKVFVDFAYQLACKHPKYAGGILHKALTF